MRCGANGENDRELPANFRSVTATEFATVLGDKAGPAVSTTEHVLAALFGLGVDNAIVEVDGPEIPIMDGSAAAFRRGDRSGRHRHDRRRRGATSRCSSRCGSTPTAATANCGRIARGLRVETEIDFDHPLIGRQKFALDLEPQAFRRELARARTFGFMRDVTKLWNAGYALGASFENTVVIAEDRVLNADGMRFPDEFVRHKAVDALGDLALAGAPLIGAYRSVRGGHKLNHAVVTALMNDPTAWTYTELEEPRAPAARPCRSRRRLRRAGLWPRDLLICLTFSRLNPGRLSA